jgi:hypothetical protein
MKFTFLSKTLRTAGLTALLTALVGTQIHQAAQAQFGVLEPSFMACSPGSIYFSDPDFMYTPSDFEPDQAIIDAQNASIAEREAIDAAVTTFAVALDAPIGYKVKEVNGVAVEIPPEIEQAIWDEMAAEPSREKVRMLNDRYGEYATFGQQMNLVYSSEQVRRLIELQREDSARFAASMTPEERREHEAAYGSSGPCQTLSGYGDMGFIGATRVVEIGERPDLDARLREDTTGATFFR